MYGDHVLLEGRQLYAEQDAGFVQSFFWFCEEASFLAWEYKAREGVKMAPKRMEEFTAVRSKGGAEKRTLKLKIQFRNSARGRAGVWRVD